MGPNEQAESGELIHSSDSGTGVQRLPPEVEIANVRQFMETLLARVDMLQQNQAMQFAGVHDRLDAVELELPLIQEQGALRMRDLEARIGVEIEEATAGLQEQVSGKFGSMAAQIEIQGKELSEMRESKKMAESKLDRVIQDIERLCGSFAPAPAEIQRPVMETAPSPIRSRIAEHIRRAAVDAAPDESNPLVGDPIQKIAAPDATIAAIAAAPPADVPSPAPQTKPFDDWKRQFMQDAEPLSPKFDVKPERKTAPVICPRCYSERTRPSSHNRLDTLLGLAGFMPYRCRSCTHRFYKRTRTPAGLAVDEADSQANREEAVETR